jgi:ketosteroid isomerase-like protein
MVAMTDRLQIERLLNELYAGRLRADLAAVCGAFTDDATFQITSTSHVSPVVVKTTGAGEFRPLLALLLKTFRLDHLTIRAMIIDGAKAAVHWEAEVHSRITGARVPTQLIDLIEIRDGRIASYIEFSVSV